MFYKNLILLFIFFSSLIYLPLAAAGNVRGGTQTRAGAALDRAGNRNVPGRIPLTSQYYTYPQQYSTYPYTTYPQQYSTYPYTTYPQQYSAFPQEVQPVQQPTRQLYPFYQQPYQPKK